MDTPRPSALTRTCGSLTITVGYDGAAHTGPFGLRHRWTYRIQDAVQPERTPAEGVDLYPARQSPANAREALGTLLALLTIAGGGYADQLQNPGSASAGLVRFAAWVPEAAHHNTNELAALALELTSTEHGPEHATVPARNAASTDHAPSGEFEPDHEPPVWWLDRADLLTPETPASPDPAPTIGHAPGKASGPSL